MLAQADVVAARLASHGYTYVNIDAGWLGGFDTYGRPVANATTFPDGIRHIADYVHQKGLQLGIYLAVGLDIRAYGGGDTPIFGTTNCHTCGRRRAAVYGCGGCSGGAKVGFLGGSGYLTVNNVMAPVAGTYLMRLAYVDGDSSRTAVVTVNGTPFQLPLSGTNDNNWDAAQLVTVPVNLNAGPNTIEFGNPNGYVSDIDKITI